MSQLNEAAIRDVVTEVLSQLHASGVVASPAIVSSTGRHGVFGDAASAAKAARSGFEQLSKKGWAGRAKVVEIVKTMCAANA